jgi:hypothetical protein
VQNRNGTPGLLASVRHAFRQLRHVLLTMARQKTTHKMLSKTSPIGGF